MSIKLEKLKAKAHNKCTGNYEPSKTAHQHEEK